MDSYRRDQFVSILMNVQKNPSHAEKMRVAQTAQEDFTVNVSQGLWGLHPELPARLLAMM